MSGEPIQWLVTERRHGRWMLGDDWVRYCGSEDEARDVAAEWERMDAVVGVFALVQVDTVEPTEAGQ